MSNWHRIDPRRVVSELDSSFEGLSPDEANRRLDKYGKNELKERKKTTVIDVFLRQFKSFVVFLLAAAAVVSAYLGGTLDAAIIAIILAVNAIIGTFHEYRAENMITALRKLQTHTITVIRQGKEFVINAAELVPGDLVLLQSGDKVPADGRIIESANLAIDESILTGESSPVGKASQALRKDVILSDRKNMAYATTLVTSGKGKMLVTETGEKTEVGRIYSRISQAKEVFPLEAHMQRFTQNIGKAAIIGVVVLSTAGYFLLNYSVNDILELSVAQAVSFIPEGLPIVVTIALAIGVSEMAARRALVRKLPAIETIGAVDVICVDKTGTLTKNKMVVKTLWIGKKTFRAEDSRLFENGSETESGEVPGFVELAKTAVLCNDAFIDGGGKRAGDPMELALLDFASDFGMDKERLEEMNGRMGEVPFDPQNKYMLTLNRHSNEVFYRLKGAPERVASMCDRIADASGVKRITSKDILEIHQTTERFARKGLRVMAFAYKKKSYGSELDKGYVFSGLIALQDPLRPEAKDAVERAKGAGIRLVMITGDHRLTAETIAREAGILGKKDIVLTGEELEEMSDHELRKACGRVAVYARTTSDHKLRIVKALKAGGHRVAMTGDGVNDALALKEADVGVALGSGTEVAKEASDIVIVDDNFASLIDAVEEGRHSSMNIRKVIKYLFSTNIAEVMFLMIILFSPVWLGSALPLALLPVHILYVNLVTDGFCDVTLATERKDRTLMKEKPQKFAGGFFTRDVWKFIAITSAITTAGLFWAYSSYLGSDGNIAHVRTMVFTLLSFFQLWSAINARTNEESVFSAGLFSNRYLSAAIVVSILTQLLVIYHPFFNEAMKTVPLGFSDWALILGLSSSLFFIFEALKFLERRGFRTLG